MSILVALRNYLLLAAAVTVLAAIPVSQQLQFDQRIESFFADDNPDLRILQRSRQEFGGDEFVIVAWTEDRLFAVDVQPYPPNLEAVLAVDFLPAVDSNVATKIRNLTATLNGIPGVNSSRTQHVADLLDSARAFKPMRRAMVRQFEGTLVGQDGRTTGILLELMPEADSSVSRADTLAQIRRAAQSIDGEVAVAGEPVQVHDMFEMVQEDGNLLFLVSLVLLSAVLFLMFRSIRWVLAPVGLVMGTVVATRAILVLVGAELSMVSSMLNSLVTVIGIATCMHVIVHYRDLRNASLRSSDPGQSPPTEFPAIARQTLHEMAAPVFWTFVTTAIGFASLLVSQITPVRSFSIMMCLAIGVATVGCAIILPATLGSGSRLRIPATVPLESWLDRALLLNCKTVEKQPVGTAIVCALLFLLAIPGVLRLTVETDFSKNFKESSTIVRSLDFVESRLGGAGSWEVSFDTPERLTDDFLKSIKRLAEQLREMGGPDDALRVLSLTDMTDVPPRIFGPVKTLIRVKREQPELITNFYNETAQRMRIVLRSVERQSAEAKLEQITQIRECVRDFFDGETTFEQATRPEASGMFVLLAELISSLLSDQLMSFIVACSGIFACMTVAFRSLRIGIISLFPNVFPVAVVMGTLGWIGEPVNIGTAMITSVSMGLTVDSTIHYITAFQRARRHYSVDEALRRAHASAGRALVFAHVALTIGFLVLTASRFIPLVYFGALLSLSMIGGIFGDLVLLPLLLRWAAGGRDENSPSTSDELPVSADLRDTVA